MTTLPQAMVVLQMLNSSAFEQVQWLLQTGRLAELLRIEPQNTDDDLGITENQFRGEWVLLGQLTGFESVFVVCDRCPTYPPKNSGNPFRISVWRGEHSENTKWQFLGQGLPYRDLLLETWTSKNQADRAENAGPWTRGYLFDIRPEAKWGGTSIPGFEWCHKLVHDKSGPVYDVFTIIRKK